jgi:hypothetical protein
MASALRPGRPRLPSGAVVQHRSASRPHRSASRPHRSPRGPRVVAGLPQLVLNSCSVELPVVLGEPVRVLGPQAHRKLEPESSTENVSMSLPRLAKTVEDSRKASPSRDPPPEQRRAPSPLPPAFGPRWIIFRTQRTSGRVYARWGNVSGICTGLGRSWVPQLLPWRRECGRAAGA